MGSGGWGSEQRIEVFVKIQKKIIRGGGNGSGSGGGGLGGQGGCERRSGYCENSKKKNRGLGVCVGGGGVWCRRGEVSVNAKEVLKFL